MENITSNLNPIQIESSDISKITCVHNFSNIFGGELLSDFNLIRFIVKPNCLSDVDQHKVKEYWYFAKGSGLLYIDGKEIVATEGELYFFNSLVKHQVKNSSDSGDLEILSIWW